MGRERSLFKRVFFFSGPLGPKRSGNQSIKNTILGYLDAGYSVWHFGMVSASDAGHSFDSLRENGRYRYFGLPKAVMETLATVNRLRRSATKAVQPPEGGLVASFPDLVEQVDLGNEEITYGQILVAAVYAAFEFARGFLPVLLCRPVLLYGYEIYGIPTASMLGRLSGIRSLSRYQGTYITPENYRCYPVRYHFRMMKKPVTFSVMANDGTRGDWALQKAGVPREKTLFITNGLDDGISGSDGDAEGIASLRNELIGDADYLLGIFNRAYPFKRIDRAIRLWAGYVAQGANIRFVVGGGGPQWEALQQLAHELGIQERIRWEGKIPHKLMAQYYRACDAVFVVNDYANTGNQVMECLYLGVPLIATDDGNNSSLFRTCPYALFFPFASPPLDWADVLAKIDRKGHYQSSSIQTWASRMAKEIEWIEERTRRMENHES
jgi:glycosyltransferase involved in cell wall biosynthesis